MFRKMEQQIVDASREANERGELTAKKVRGITQMAVSNTAEVIKARAEELREIAREAVTATVQTLEETGTASRENITATLEGTVDGIKRAEAPAMETAWTELTQANTHLEEKEAQLSNSLREALAGATEAADSFSGEVKLHIQSSVTDAKLKNTELLGLTRETVKEAVRKSIEAGCDTEETVVHITRDATERGLAESRFAAERARKVAETVLSSAVDAAEELDSHVREVSSTAAEGVRKGLIRAVEKTKESISTAGGRVKDFSDEELEQTRRDLEAIEDLFVETLRKVAVRSGEVAGEVLNELADDARRAGSSLREKTSDAAQMAAKRLRELGVDAADKTAETSGKTARLVADEARELGSRALDIARGAVTGMWEGAKEAFHKDKEGD